MFLIGLLGCGEPGRVVTDDQLRDDLVLALAGNVVAFDERYPQLHCAIVAEPMSVEHFREVASRVPGWELIAVVGPYNSGKQLSAHPLLVAQEGDLSASIAEVAGWENDSIYDLSVIRGGEVVAHLWLTMNGNLPGEFVVARR